VRSSTSRPVRLLAATTCAAALGLAAACGGGSSAPAGTPAPAPAAAPSADPHAGMSGMDGMSGMGGMAHGEGAGGVELYAVQTGPLGVVVTDGQGRLLYGSMKDTNTPPTSRCTGECTREWLPVTVPAGQEPELLGVKPESVGRYARPDGTSQLTLAGWPVYVNRDDDGEAHTAAPSAPGAWFVLTPQGERKQV
jgi:predicted lipoprotein with Yx(FWY)xxD motif